MTSIDSAIMMVWLRPSKIEGRASGMCTSRKICHSLQPEARAAPTRWWGTSLMPVDCHIHSGALEFVQARHLARKRIDAHPVSQAHQFP